MSICCDHLQVIKQTPRQQRFVGTFVDQLLQVGLVDSQSCMTPAVGSLAKYASQATFNQVYDYHCNLISNTNNSMKALYN